MKKTTLFILVCISIQYSILGQNLVGDLVISKKMTKSIEIGVTDNYQIRLNTQQYALLNVKQKGIDVKIETYGPNGIKIEEFDSPNNNDGSEIVLIDATKDGIYEVRVSPLGEDKKIKRGDYEIELISINDSVKHHLDKVIKNLYQRGHIPGFAISLTNAENIVYQNAQGYANIQKKVPYTIRTVQNIASISKTFIGCSLMKLVEQKKLSLDKPINEILPFSIINPYYPDIPITVRHLATHTATINEQSFYHKAYILLDDEALKKYSYHKHFLKELNRANKNKIISLPEYLKNHLSIKGKNYKKKNFFKNIPGDNWYYSNVGAALAAYIVELVSGEPYKVFVKNNIIEPLGLESASWLEGIKGSFVQTVQYDSNGNPLPKRTIITYPDGGIYINILDLSKYLMQFIKGNKGVNGILSSESLKEMMKVQHEQQEGKFKGRKDGLFWEFSKSGVIGHSGGDYGVSAYMYYNPTTNLGYTYMCNIMPTESDYSNAQSRSIWSVLKRYAKHF